MTDLIWFLTRPRRLQEEYTAVNELSATESWLEEGSWQFEENLRVSYTFSIKTKDSKFNLKLIYPECFPDLPPMVKPQEEVRLSDHQYGKSGELCLEIRPDNWTPEILGSAMIKSAYDLLVVESAESSKSVEVPNAHQDTIGQRLRSSIFRIYLTHDALTALEKIDDNTNQILKIRLPHHPKRSIITIESIGNEGVLFKNNTPEDGLLISKRDGLVIKHGVITATKFKSISSNIDTFEAFLKEINLPEVVSDFLRIQDETFILLYTASGWECLNFWTEKKEEKRHLFLYKPVIDENTSSRLSEDYKFLQSKKLGIIGLGSLGSKIAVSLTRSGLGNITIIDPDIFMEANLVRHELDRNSMGHYKVDSLNERFKLINPDIIVNVYRALIGGQESTNFTNTILTQLSDCDLIIDATAEPNVFNICGSTVTKHKIPFIWSEVYEGGIGGMIARLIPDNSPTPYLARKQINNWLHQNAPKWERDSNLAAYSSSDGLNIADDSDITAIASHVTRMTIDTLLSQNLYDANVYFVGLKKAWMFTGPFHTIPLNLIKEGEWGEQKDEVDSNELIKILAPLLESLKPDD